MRRSLAPIIAPRTTLTPQRIGQIADGLRIRAFIGDVHSDPLHQVIVEMPNTLAAVGRTCLMLLCVLAASTAEAYRDAQLEELLRRNEPKALTLLPAKGFKDGAAGVFRAHGLYLVPGSERAWCTDHSHGVLKPGCYIEFFVQGEGLRARDEHGDPCGQIGRWYKAPGVRTYVPTPGPFISRAIGNGDWAAIESTIYGEPDATRLPERSCGPVEGTQGKLQ